MANHTGQQLGNYRLSRLLGAGGFARVYLGEHIHLGTLAAIKVLDRRLTDEDLTTYLIMNYAPNGSLYDICHNDIPLPLERILPYVRQAASALNYAHDNRGIHRDVKPQNMLLGNHNEVLLSDFGIAVLAHTEGSLTTEEMAGTAQYMAPEQILGKSRPASDQYALGIVYIGSSDYKLYAINATTGKILWFATTQNVLTSSPTVANGVVYVGSGDTRLYALNASDVGIPRAHRCGLLPPAMALTPQRQLLMVWSKSVPLMACSMPSMLPKGHLSGLLLSVREAVASPRQPLPMAWSILARMIIMCMPSTLLDAGAPRAHLCGAIRLVPRSSLHR
jgi:serine/threonine protein kinase